MADGHLNKCKDCTKSDVSQRYSEMSLIPEYIEYERKRGRDKYHRLYEGTGKAKPRNNEKYWEKYPEKKQASSFAGKLTAPFTGLERHHWSYNEEHYIDVVWLSKKDHMKGHRFIKYDQERKMYRRFDTGELLDTKIKHELFIKYCIKHMGD